MYILICCKDLKFLKNRKYAFYLTFNNLSLGLKYEGRLAHGSVKNWPLAINHFLPSLVVKSYDYIWAIFLFLNNHVWQNITTPFSLVMIYLYMEGTMMQCNPKDFFWEKVYWEDSGNFLNYYFEKERLLWCWGEWNSSSLTGYFPSSWFLEPQQTLFCITMRIVKLTN